jgi:hypothetical protein
MTQNDKRVGLFSPHGWEAKKTMNFLPCSAEERENRGRKK